MSVGSEIIDNEHKYLFSLVNCVVLAIKVGDPKEIQVYIEQLLEYTEEHFSHEEKLQIKISYPGYAENKKQHQMILEKLETLKKKLLDLNELSPTKITDKEINAEITSSDGNIEIVEESNEDEQSQVLLIEEISQLLRHWILDHVVLVDLKMHQYLSKLPLNQRKP